jgi:hypothetical protein
VFTTQDEETLQWKEAVLQKKLAKGHGGWCQQKEILGWLFDMHEGTMELTKHRKQWVRQIFDDLQGKSWVSVKKWQRMLGELHFMGEAITGAAGLFGAMQLGLKHRL